MTTPINSERYKAIMNARYGICNNKPEIKNVIFQVHAQLFCGQMEIRQSSDAEKMTRLIKKRTCYGHF